MPNPSGLPMEPSPCPAAPGCTGAIDLGNGFFQCSDGSYNKGCSLELISMGSCSSDLDCPVGEACLPASLVGLIETVFTSVDQTHACFSAACRTNADCDSGECGLGLSDPACWFDEPRLFCRTNHDDCRTHGDCQKPYLYGSQTDFVSPHCVSGVCQQAWDCE